jgi:anti-sigma B factor antagonist
MPGEERVMQSSGLSMNFSNGSPLDSSIKIIRPIGSLTAKSISRFNQELTAAISSDADELLVDMGQVNHIDNDGLVALMNAFNSAQALGKRVSLHSLPPSVRIVFELTQLDRVFTVIDGGAAQEALVA